MKENVDKYVIKESKIFKTRRMYTVNDALSSLILSKFCYNYICTVDKHNSFLTHCSDFFTSDGKLIRASAEIYYEVLNPMKYSYELLTENILDIIVRSVLASYFIDNNYDVLINTNIDRTLDNQRIMNKVNSYINKYLPYIKVNSISNIDDLVKKSTGCNDFDLMLKNNVNSKKYDLVSIKADKPLVYYAEDDLKCKRFYHKDIFVAENEVLYYAGKITKPGKYHGKKAKGNIIATGKHVYSPSEEIYKNEDGELTGVYPNFIYEVLNVENYLNNYATIRNLFNILSSQIVLNNYRNEDIIKDIDGIYSRLNKTIRQTIEDIESFGLKLKCVTYTMKHPNVETEYVRKKDKKGYSYIELD